MNRNKGFVGIIILIIVALVTLKYFLNWDIFDAAASAKGKGTIDYLRDIVNTAWLYLLYPVKFLWEGVIKPWMEKF